MIRTLKKTTLSLLIGGAVALFAGESADAFKPGNYKDENGAVFVVGADGNVAGGAYSLGGALRDWYVTEIADGGTKVRYAHSGEKGKTGVMEVTALADDQMRVVIAEDDGKYTAKHKYQLSGPRK